MIESLLGKGTPANIGREISEVRRAPTSSPSAVANGLSSAQNSLIDQIDISEGATRRLADLQNLDRQLTRFLDVLKGNRSAGSVIAELDAERGRGGNSIFGTQTRTALSASQVNAIRETTALTAEINNNGELDLILTNVRDTLSQSTFNLSSQQRSFAAFAG